MVRRGEFENLPLLSRGAVGGGVGCPSETKVRRGLRVVHGDKELAEKLGRNDLCPCGSGRRFAELLVVATADRDAATVDQPPRSSNIQAAVRSESKHPRPGRSRGVHVHEMPTREAADRPIGAPPIYGKIHPSSPPSLEGLFGQGLGLDAEAAASRLPPLDEEGLSRRPRLSLPVLVSRQEPHTEVQPKSEIQQTPQ